MSLKPAPLLVAAFASATPNSVTAQQAGLTTLDEHFHKVCTPLYNAAVDAVNKGQPADFDSIVLQCAGEYAAARKLLEAYRNLSRMMLLIAAFGNMKLMELSMPLPTLDEMQATFQGLRTAVERASEGNISGATQIIEALPPAPHLGKTQLSAKKECEKYRNALLEVISTDKIAKLESDAESAAPLLKRSREWRSAKASFGQAINDQRERIRQNICGRNHQQR